MRFFNNTYGLYVYALLCILMLSASCKPTQTTAQPEELRKTAAHTLGTDIESYSNSTGEYILFIQRKNPTNATRVLRFVVMHVASQKIVIEQSFMPGYVKWASDSSLEVLSAPGTLQENESMTDYVKIIDISSH